MPRIIPRHHHHLSRQAISKNALKVLYHLQRHGFQAYLVGGSIRDILLGAVPKDFDIATDAHPEQIKRIFRNCLLIGRRFRIAHIRFPDEIIEVTTFRASASKSDHRRLSATGMLLRDNVYGSIHEDVWRRDFSINALYYNIRDFSIIDYCNGLDDIQHQRIRMIGSPEERYQEDPVRLLRAIRLAAKFPTFKFDEATEAALIQQAPRLTQVPSSRLFEETLKLFHSGSAVITYRLLKQYGLFQQLFPMLSVALEDIHAVRWIETALAHTDQRFRDDKPLSPAFLFAVLLWPVLMRETQCRITQAVSYSIAYPQAMREVIANQQKYIAITRFCSQMMQDIWLMQSGLVKRHPKQIKRLLMHPRFRAAYDFLLIRVECRELPETLGMWWTARVQQQNSD